MKFLIELTDKIQDFSNHVKVTRMNGDIVEGIYFMTLNDLLSNIKDATETDEEHIETPILPRNCIKFIWRNYAKRVAEVFILIPKSKWDIKFFDTPLKQVGFPRMLFHYIVERKKVRLETILALKDDGPVTAETPIYHFPFSHVSESGIICMGGNQFPDIDRIQQLETYHNIFISSPFTTDYGAKTLTGKRVEELFYELVGRDFNDEWLKPLSNSYYDIKRNKSVSTIITLGEKFGFDEL